MAQTGFTPIKLYYSATASATPLAANLAAGELAINAADGKLFYKDSSNVVQVIAGKAGAGVAGGSNTQVQYNSSNSLTGSANLTFNGTTLTANTLNLTNALAVLQGGTGTTTSTGSGSVVLSNSPVLVTPALGTPSAAVLTNATGLPISTGVAGLGAGVATFLATPSSANLAAAVTGETGSGALVFATNPTFVNPALGSPLSGDFTGGSFSWPTFNQNTTGYAANVAGGAANRILYQSGVNATTTSANFLYNGTSFIVGYTGAAVISGERVSVVGAANGNAVGVLADSSGGTGISVLHTYASGANTAYMMRFYNSSSSVVGTITSTGSATAYNTSSDYRLKNSIAPMVGALAKVAALKPVTYKWNTDGSEGEGFIAHELAEVCPHAVAGSKDAVDENGIPQYQGVDASFLIATLTAAIQEQQTLIQSLADRITQLEIK